MTYIFCHELLKKINQKARANFLNSMTFAGSLEQSGAEQYKEIVQYYYHVLMAITAGVFSYVCIFIYTLTSLGIGHKI